MPNDKRADRSEWAVLLLAHGAPDRLADVPAFVLSLRDGRRLPEAVIQEIIHRYRAIGGGSPLSRLTQQQAEALTKRLGCPVYVGMRNWRPYIADAVRGMSRDGVTRAVAICMAPQNSRTSVGLYRKYLNEAVEKIAPRLQPDFVETWHDQPDLIAAFRERLTAALDRAEAEAGRAVPVIFTAHSVPEKTIAAGDPYDEQVRTTAALVAGATGRRLGEWRVAYQSQGMTADSWIGPTVESQIDALAAAGHRHVLIAPIGFVCDHVEILYDVDIVFRESGASKGVKVWRSESLNDSPMLVSALASIVSSRIERAALWAR